MILLIIKTMTIDLIIQILTMGWKNNSNSSSGEDWDLIASTVPNHEKSLIAHIEEQLPYLLETSREHLIARYFLEALEPSGWLGKSLDEIHIETNVDYEDLENVLIKLQGAELTGLFLGTYLNVYDYKYRTRGLMCTNFQILLENLTLLGKGDLKGLIKKLVVMKQKLKTFCNNKKFRPKARLLHSPRKLQICINQIYW